MEIEAIVKIVIFVVVLTVVIAGVIFLFKGKGGEMLDSIRRSMRFG